MALPKITITKGEGGLQRPLPNEDHYSGILFHKPAATALPSGYGTDRVKQITSVADAEAKGILSDSGDYTVLHYHIKEFFRRNPDAYLFVYIADEQAATYTFSEVTALQDFADGKLRQIGVFVHNLAFATTMVSALQTALDTLETNDAPCVGLLVADFSAVVDLTALSDLRTLDSEYVSVLFGEDGANAGAALATSEGYTVGILGAALGALSLAAVNENIGWIQKFNMTDGIELSVPAFANADLVKDNLDKLAGIHDKGYICLYKENGLSGTYITDTPTSTLLTSDYAYIENTRTIQKAIRGVRIKLLPQLKSPLVKDASGLLEVSTQSYLEGLAGQALAEMQRNAEISAYDVAVDRDLTDGLKVTIRIVSVDVARKIDVTISYTLSIE